MVLVLTKEDLMKALTMKETIEAVERAFKEMAYKTAKLPLRTIIDVNEHKGTLFIMPAYLSSEDALSIKIVSLFEENPRKYGLPTILAFVVLNDPKTGMPLALMEGGFITAMRTGAASGVATKYLARNDSKTVGVIGAGVQAKTQLLAMAEVRDLKKALIFDIQLKRSLNLAEEMSKKLGIDIFSVKKAREAVKGVDIVITATTAKEPVLNADWIEPGTHINAVGWMGSEARELDSKTIKKAKIVVDSKDAALSESGDIIIPIREGVITEDTIYAELGELVIGKKEGRVSRDEVTLWKSVGLAIQDASTANLAYQKAKIMGLGTELKL
jgi:ornithine cyclodeaminase/alanine dehydrogenase